MEEIKNEQRELKTPENVAEVELNNLDQSMKFSPNWANLKTEDEILDLKKKENSPSPKKISSSKGKKLKLSKSPTKLIMEPFKEEETVPFDNKIMS